MSERMQQDGTDEPAGLIQRAADGHMSREVMMDRLTALRYTHGEYDPTGGDGYQRGTWDTIEAAVGRELLTNDEYDHLRRHIEAQA